MDWVWPRNRVWSRECHMLQEVEPRECHMLQGVEPRESYVAGSRA